LACAEFLYDWFRGRRIDVRLDRLAPGRANVVARVPGRSDGPTLLLAGHTDTSYSGDPDLDAAGLGTVGPNERPHAYEIGDNLYGLGAFNMKGGLAAAAIALADIATAGGLRGDVLFAGLCGESEKAPAHSPLRPRVGSPYQGRGFGARRFLAVAQRIDAAVVAGPSAMRVVNAQAGSLFVELIACGRAAYLGRREGGSTGPLEAAAALVDGLGTWGRERAARLRHETGLGVVDPRLTIGAVEGGWSFAPSTSPGRCHLYVDLRTVPGESQVGALRGLLDRARELVAGRPGIDLRARVYARTRGSETPVSALLVRTAVSVVENELGLPASPFPAGSADTTNDTNHFRRRGIPAIKVGPGVGLGAGPAAVAERGVHVTRGDLAAACRFYVALAHRLSDHLEAPGGSPS
jgi:acetylornithine deacetylase/succinyl-diaminopimelate desuccinylase-like protein